MAIELLYKIHEEKDHTKEDLDKTAEEKESLKRYTKALEDQLTKLTITSEEEKKLAVSRVAALLEYIRKEHAKLTEDYIEVQNQHNLNIQRSLVEKILFLHEREFSYSVVKRISEISDRVKEMSEGELKHEIEEFAKTIKKINRENAAVKMINQ